MPYQRCASCGVVSYAPLQAAGTGCPECGLPLAREGAPEQDTERRLDQLLGMTRELLDADLALLTEITGGREVAVRHAGGWDGLGPEIDGTSLRLRDTLCNAMLEGEIGHYVADVAADPRVRDKRAVRVMGIGAWLGVPIRLAEQTYVLCCLLQGARPSLGEREVRLLAGLAESVRATLEARPMLAGAVD